MNDQLRKECRLLKALQRIKYSEIAGYLEIPVSSFYNWMTGNYQFGEDKQRQLSEIITNLKED